MPRWLNLTVQVPVGIVLLFTILMVASNAITTYQTRLLRDLFREYWRGSHAPDEECPL